MEFARAHRFHVPLDSGDDDDDDDGVPAPSATPFSFVGDVRERTPCAPSPPAAPTLKGSATGSPAHRKRTRASAFRQQRTARAAESGRGERDAGAGTDAGGSTGGASFDELDKRRIDGENRRRLADMSPEEVERERRDLFAGLSPALLERLLRRANVDDAGAAFGQQRQPAASAGHVDEPATTGGDEGKPATAPEQKGVTFSAPSPAAAPAPPSPAHPPPGTHDPADALERSHPRPPPSIHFPRPPQPPALDPDSPSFLADLHEAYFPTLAHDASKLAWMSPATPASSYAAGAGSLPASALRFSFAGALLPPRAAAAVPVAAGLHHHGDAPDAAGYTLPELARLARSAVPAQRCLAFQTLGRVLYRLGAGQFGDETALDRARAARGLAWMEGGDDDDGDEGEEEDGQPEGEAEAGGAAELARGLWECVERGRVLETLQEEANREAGHLTARSLALEALWNWRRGGGRKRRAV